MESATASAHRILEYLLTKAVVTGDAKNASIKIPYQDLAQDWEGAEHDDVDLIVEIKTKWAAKDDETLPLEISEGDISDGDSDY